MVRYTHCALVVLCLTALFLETHETAEFLTVIMGPGESWLTTSKNISIHKKTPTHVRADDSTSAFSRAENDLITNQVSPPHPPLPEQSAKMARFIVHYSSWGSLSHISLQKEIYGSPLARVYSLSDGPIRASSGVPYFYLTPNDPELRDMFKSPRASLTLTLAQTPYCRIKAYDPEDPRCAQVILTGKLVILKNSTAEWHQAQRALFSRHPVMRTWPESHHWICCKLDIKRILVADNFGGNKYPSVEEYFRAHPDICSHDNPLLDMAFY